jgi:putative membrane protein
LSEWLVQAYPWLKALHVISVISWMAGLLYLPRLFVYHTTAEPGSEMSETFKVMERRLSRGIMNPAMVGTLVFGLAMLGIPGYLASAGPWLWLKLALVAGLLIMHALMLRWRNEFAADCNTRPQKFYRVVNEVPTLLMVVIVILVVVRPSI